MHCFLRPPGATQTPERKHQIYAICRRFGILILEDDPYYYLQYTPGQPPQGLQDLGKSYLALDVDHRVMRLDSFSKARPQIPRGRRNVQIWTQWSPGLRPVSEDLRILADSRARCEAGLADRTFGGHQQGPLPLPRRRHGPLLLLTGLPSCLATLTACIIHL